jgi:hypothetical protein
MKTIDELRAETPATMHALTSREVTSALTARHLIHVIIGGHALAAHGSIRNTEDVDVIAGDMLAAAQAIADAHGHATVQRLPGARNVSVLGPDGSRMVDVLSMYDGHAFRYAIDHQVAIDGLPVPAVDAFIALKFEAMTNANRQKSKRSLDLHDIEFLVMRHLADDSADGHARVQQIAAIIESDAMGDAERGGARWLKLYRDIRSGRDFSK